MAAEHVKTTMFVVFVSVAVFFHFLPTLWSVWFLKGQPSDIGDLSDPPVEDTLAKVTFVFRHGDRAPLIWQLDRMSAQSDEWPDGYGELTKTGKKNAYLLGQRLRKRYDKILTPHYKSSNFRATSTTVERAMMSANLVLAGLYPPQDHQKWSDEINWMPVPVHRSEMSGEFFNCKRIHHEVITNIRQLDPGLCQPIIEFLRERNEKIDTANALKEVLGRYDTAVAKIRNGKELKDWEEEFVAMAAGPMSEVFEALTMKTDVQKQITSNVLAGHVINLLKSDHSVTMYSAHDIQLYLLSGALGHTMKRPPLPTACIMIELHHKADGQNVVKAFYLHEATGALDAIDIQGEKEMAWEKFLNLATPMGKEEYDELCNTTPHDLEHEKSEKELISFMRSISKQA